MLVKKQLFTAAGLCGQKHSLWGEGRVSYPLAFDTPRSSYSTGLRLVAQRATEATQRVKELK